MVSCFITAVRCLTVVRLAEKLLSRKSVNSVANFLEHARVFLVFVPQPVVENQSEAEKVCGDLDLDFTANR